MASCHMVMAMVDNGSLKYIIWGDINAFLISENTLRDLPVR